MGQRKVGCVIVFLTFLCALAIHGSQGRKGLEGFDSFLSNADSSKIDKEMSEQMWINCKLDLMHIENTVEAFSMHLQEEMDSETKYVSTWNLQKAISILPPQMKQTLLNCLRQQYIPFHIPGEEDGSKNWYMKHLESLFSRPDISRRYLGEKFLKETNPTHSPSPSPGLGVQSPTHAPTPIPAVQSPLYAPTPGPAVQSPTYAPTPVPAVESPTDAPEPSFYFTPPSPDNANYPPPAKALRKPFSPPDFDSNERPSAVQHPGPHSDKHDANQSIVTVVVVTAAGTFLFALVLFCCYSKCRSNTYTGNEHKDENPLLKLSFSDISVDSSRRSALGNPINKENFGIFSSKRSQNGKVSSFDSNLSVESDIQSSTLEASSLGEFVAAAKFSAESSIASRNTNAPTPLIPPLKLPPGRLAPPSRTPSGPPPPPPPPPPAPPVSPAPRAPPASAPAPVPAPALPAPPPSGPRPPPPPKGALLPPRAPQPLSKPSPLGPNRSGSTALRERPEASKTKLKPFFWDKVLANPDQSMVWHEISSGSFQFDEEMIENLFGYANADRNKNEHKKGSSAQDSFPQYIQILDSKKAQNLSILLKALNVTTEEVCDALHEGNELPIELLQTLLKMAPSPDEELKLRLYCGEISQLGPAERFLKTMVDIPFAFKRMDSLLFMISFQEETSGVKESLATLEVACSELRNSRLFLKLLEAVLKTGNRMNDGTFRGGAQAFKLDTLLKLSDVKGTDGKTTLLHFVVQEIIRSEGIRAARAARESQSFSSVNSEDLSEDPSIDTEDYYKGLGLQVVSGLSAELENVRKAAVLDTDGITATVSKLGHALVRSRGFLNTDMKNIEEESGFHHSLQSFLENAEGSITWLLQEETRIMALVKSTADYFHGKAVKDEGLRLFVIVREFLIMVDKACKEVRESRKLASRPSRNKESPIVPPSDHCQKPSVDSRETPSQDLRQRLFPAITDRRIDDSSSDDDSL